MSTIPSDNFISQKAQEFAQNLKLAAQQSQNEEDIKIATEIEIRKLSQEAGITLNPQYEFTVASGRIDAAYERVFIEYKNPKSNNDRLSLNPNDSGNQKAIEQIKSRFPSLEQDLGHSPESLLGIACDGNYLIFVRYRQQQWEISGPVTVTNYSVERFLRALFNLGISGKPFLPQYLAQDFGAEGSIAKKGIQTFYQTLCATNNNKVKTFFQQWQTLFSQVCGYDVQTPSETLQKLGKFYGIEEGKKLHTPELLFAVHSYYALLIKLLAAEIVSLSDHNISSFQKKIHDASTAAQLQQEMNNLESGGLFKALGIVNFLEGDLFAWYLSIWSEKIAEIIKQMGQKLAEYNPSTLSEDPTKSRDLLKQLYQQLFPKSLRHDLGEYYTPDWLAEHTLNQIGFDGNPDQRLLDPSCGSGTFLVMIIAQIKQWHEQQDNNPYSKEMLAQKILKNVIGFDLNPLAVMTARANYLVAIRDLIPNLERIEIPIYLCDAIMTPSVYGSGVLFTETGLSVNEIGSTKELKTAVGPFYIPAEITDSFELVSQYTEVIEFCIQNNYSSEDFIDFCQGRNLPITSRHIHEGLYRQLLELDRDNLNGIWARIIKNAFAPLFIGKVDFVVGNPPWVNWESLPENYRDTLKPLWQEYELFSLSGSAGRLGGGKKDLSMLFVYVAVDNYLDFGGKLGFVITQSIFKTKGAGDGFRRLKFAKETNNVFLKPLTVDDLSQMQVFEGATNRTAIFICEKSQSSFEYPVQYRVWEGGSRLKPELTLKEVEGKIKRQLLGAIPIAKNEPNSPWLTAPAAILPGLNKVIGQSDYKGYEGVNTGGLNGCYWLRILDKLPNGHLLIENLSYIGKIAVNKVQTVIEPDLVYPLLRGRDVSRWSATPSVYVLLVQEPQTRAGIPEREMKLKYPKTFAYLKKFEQQLRQRSGYRRYFKPTDPFYSMYNVGAYTLAPWKVLWPEVGHTVKAGVCGSEQVEQEKPDLPDHTIVGISCDRPSEAFYLAGLLNSTPAQSTVQGYIVLHPSPHILKHLAIPRFNPRSKTHLKLAEVSQKCHEAQAAGDHPNLAKLEEEIDQLAAKLWGLTPKELTAMQLLKNDY